MGVMRSRGSDEFEKAMGMVKYDLLFISSYFVTHFVTIYLVLGKVNSLKEIREVVGTNPALQHELSCSLEQPRQLLNEQMKRLSLKDKGFSTFEPASVEEIDKMWQNCLMVDPHLNVSSLVLLKTNFLILIHFFSFL